MLYAVSSKLFLQQPMRCFVFPIILSSSPPEREGNEEWPTSELFGVLQWEHWMGNAIPKPWQWTMCVEYRLAKWTIFSCALHSLPTDLAKLSIWYNIYCAVLLKSLSFKNLQVGKLLENETIRVGANFLNWAECTQHAIKINFPIWENYISWIFFNHLKYPCDWRRA